MYEYYIKVKDIYLSHFIHFLPLPEKRSAPDRKIIDIILEESKIYSFNIELFGHFLGFVFFGLDGESGKNK